MNVSQHISGLCLSSSNPIKVAEYTRLSRGMIPVIPGKDLAEIESDPDSIALYKALHAGEGIIVEDSILVVAGIPMIDIKWRLKELIERAVFDPAPLVWEVRLAFAKEGLIRIYKGTLQGNLRPWDMPGAGYDPIFNVGGVGLSLALLESRGLKDQYSARAHAFEALLKDEPSLVAYAADLPEWRGTWQND